MRVISPSLLVAAVTELSKGGKLVRAKDVFTWCDCNSVQYQGEGRTHQPLWDADQDEARGEHRLLKFKSGESRQARIGWALVPHGAKAREVATQLGWRELEWDGDKWDWLGGSAPVPTRRYGAAARAEAVAVVESAAL